MLKITPKLNTKPFQPQGKNSKSDVEVGIFYTNDMHGDVDRLSKFKTAHDEFVKENLHVPNFTIAAGDCLFGSDRQRNSLMVKLFNYMNLDALALGNHEFAGGSKKLADSLKKAEFKSFSANLKIRKGNPLRKRIKDKKLVKSAIFMKGGQKFGIIGASPFDSYINAVDKAVKPQNLDSTIKSINNEVVNLEKQGVNKIILCSHVGYKNDLKIAQETEGVDIIIGGHSHTLIEGVNNQNGENNHKLNLLSSKRKEPVIITQLGSMNRRVGYLDVVFDEKGILKTDKISNNLYNVNDFAESDFANDLIDKKLGNRITLAKVNGEYAPRNEYEERYFENPLANAFADSMLECGKSYGAEVSLFQAASIRGGMKDKITNHQVKYSIAPFNNKLKLVELSEKDLVEILKASAGSLLTSDKDVQLMRCAGMEYSVKTDKEYFLNGGKNPIYDLFIGGRKVDTVNPDENRKIKTVITDYMLVMPCLKNIMKKYSSSAKTIGNEQESFKNYLQNKKEISTKIDKPRITLSKTYDTAMEMKKVSDIVMAAEKANSDNLNKS
ncbi:MAG: bifunctional metallophosphatase/5'-nucleotidase [Candidatus Gastranaerophilaceae bacterium]